MELRSGKVAGKGDLREDSDNDPEEDVYILMEQGYAVGGNEETEGISHRTGEDVNHPHIPLLPTMDISSGRYPPTSVMRSAQYQLAAYHVYR